MRQKEAKAGPAAVDPQNKGEKESVNTPESLMSKLFFALMPLIIIFVSLTLSSFVMKRALEDPQSPFEWFQVYKDDFNRHYYRPKSPSQPPERFTVALPMSDIFKGTDVQLEIPRDVRCDLCDGKRTLSPEKVSPCTKCSGMGWVPESVQMGYLRVDKRTTCPKCHGTKAQIAEPCPSCKGSGHTQRTFTVRFHVPKGTPEGFVVNQFLQETNEEIAVTVTTINDPVFRRQDNIHLVMNRTVDLRESLAGFDFSVMHPRGHMITISKQEMTPPNSQIEIIGEGFPTPDNPDKNGNLYIGVNVVFPTYLALEKREALRRILAPLEYDI